MAARPRGHPRRDEFNYTFAPKLTDSGASSAASDNPLGTTNTTEATLIVTADTAARSPRRCLGPTTCA